MAEQGYATTGSALSSAANANSGHRNSQQRGVHFTETEEINLPLANSPGSMLNDAIAPESPKSPKSPIKATMPIKELTDELDRCSPSLTQAQASALEGALGGLREILQQVLSACGRFSGVEATGQLLPLGSYALGVICPGDTLDFVYSVPTQVSLWDMVKQLQSAFAKSSEATYVCDAGSDGALQAPGLQLTWRDIKIMILLSHSIPDLPNDNDSGIVQNTTGLFSRDVCENVLKSVTIPESFTQLLRFVRFWAKSRGVYGSDFGFFSGTAWAICCAIVCHRHQRSQWPQLVGHFFRELSRWDWTVPVAILPADGQQQEKEMPSMPSPDVCPMPVLLPVGSSMIATWNVSPTTMKIVQKELRRGYKTIKQVEAGRGHWSDVYNSAKFFQRHRHYLEFAWMASSPEVYEHWHVWAKKQVQTIVRLFESTSNDIVTLRPWPEWLAFKDAKWTCAHAIFFGLHFEQREKRSFDLQKPMIKFFDDTTKWPDAERHENQFDFQIRHMTNDQLQTWLENREKGLEAHGEAMPPSAGLQMQARGEKVSWCDMVDDELDPGGESN